MVSLSNKKIACLYDKVRITHPITTKLGSYIALVPLMTWLELSVILLEKKCRQLFFPKNLDVFFFKVKHSIGHISGIGGPNDMKWKGSASVGY